MDVKPSGGTFLAGAFLAAGARRSALVMAASLMIKSADGGFMNIALQTYARTMQMIGPSR